jgi:predicted alpha/beta hydrolase family esterase
MDMKEASAMTEASGLTNEQDVNARRLPPPSPSQDVAMRWAERLRKVTVRAPLQSLFVAFLLGIWVARRR